MSHPYELVDPGAVFSPSLLFYKDLIRRNLAHALAIAGSAQRLRPHVKTHKTREIVRMALAQGVTRHKCATIAEAEMLADCGVPDVLLAYPMVGPNCGRLARLAQRYPACKFAVLADHEDGIAQLSGPMRAAGQTVDVLIDLDTGQHRTGIAPGPEVERLYERIDAAPGLRAAGLHAYDGHNHQGTREERKRAVESQLAPVLDLRSRLRGSNGEPPRLVVGGTPTFPLYASLGLPGVEYCPGTCLLHDHGYGSRFADLSGFTPAAVLLTRVISRPTRSRVTFDLGYKAVSSDPPAGKRLALLDFPEHEQVLQNEEHLVVETAAAERYRPGDVVYAIPTHVCPTVALHRQALVVENGQVIEAWDIVARDRFLTV
jgi:D-serine deaminase-like pyridoxal phosphate-dependent protein